MAFSLYERQYLGIHGLLPPAFMTEEQQAYRVMAKLREQPDDLARYIQLDALQDRTEKLFYRVLCDNIKELMPIVYTPTVGLACQKFGFIYRSPKGIYITINDNSISKIYQILSNWPSKDVRSLLNDPFYTGLRRKRVRGEEYDKLLDNFMKACTKKYVYPLLQDMPPTKNLLEVVKTVKPDGLIGACTVGGVFTGEIISEMARINKRPIIFALSNPTSKAECTAEDAYRMTNGSVLFASGSPFENVELDGRIYKPGQGNNAYIFPGVALGAILFKAKHIPEMAFLLAARRCASFVSDKSLENYARLYPRLKDIRELSVLIAKDVGNYLYEQNLATLHPEPENKDMFIRQQIYSVEYDELINKTYDWPAKDMKHGFPVPVIERSSMDDE
ncbi:unnamed protein product [Strongylus vulgaris]|uniref:Malic enzyme NAD-binding domain-containing protein n=1 Tax=Strongylus vulgaris TaxID=40348 RepID=A0A3P7LB56_STRVU|nr:unnamed protein product [Strongylus vulgaris]